jgi:hypothetical protein
MDCTHKLQHAAVILNWQVRCNHSYSDPATAPWSKLSSVRTIPRLKKQKRHKNNVSCSIMPCLLGHRKTLHTILRSKSHYLQQLRGSHFTASELLIYMPQHHWKTELARCKIWNKNHLNTNHNLKSLWATCFVVHRPLPSNHLTPINFPSLFYLTGKITRGPASVEWCRTQLEPSTRYQSGSFSFVHVGSGFSLPAYFLFPLPEQSLILACNVSTICVRFQSFPSREFINSLSWSMPVVTSVYTTCIPVPLLLLSVFIFLGDKGLLVADSCRHAYFQNRQKIFF